MQLPNKNLILQEIPLFAGFSEKERLLLEEKSVILEYKKGQTIYLEGSPADAFYCVILGRVVTFTQDAQGNEVVLEYLHRGKYFGIISLLTGEPHSVTARAYNDCLLLVIKKEDFSSVLKNIPGLAIDLNQTLSRRIKDITFHPKTVFESTIISVFSSYAHAGKTIYALNLALSLKKETHKPVLILDICPKAKPHSLPQKLQAPEEKRADLCCSGFDFNKLLKETIIVNASGIDLLCLDYQPEDEGCVERLVALLSNLVNDYYYLVLDMPAIMDNFVFQMLNQSDLIHLISSPDSVDLQRTHNLISRLRSEFNFAEAKIKVIINEYKFSKLSLQQEQEFLGQGIFATLPKIDLVAKEKLVLDSPETEYAKVIRRISRQLGDSLVGLVLGVGVGYGFCHIGVLKVIEEEKIPVDIICGSSIGALIASLWACGRQSEEILEITREFRQPNYIWGLMDFTLPVLGFVKGKKLYQFLRKYLGNKTFYDVRLPLKIVASDVRRKEPRILDKGPLVDAIMASCSMPGVFRPFALKEGILFDGGITNPLPTEPLFKMGVKKIIAVNVTPSREDMLRQYESIRDQLATTLEAVKKRRWLSLKAYFKQKFRTNILEIVFSSIEVMQSEIAQREAQLADVVLHPDTTGLHWLELYRAEEFAKRGEEEARRNLNKIWQMINE